MTVNEFLDEVAGEDMGQAGEYAFCEEAVREVFEREFPNGAVDVGTPEDIEKELDETRRQRDRQRFWEQVYAAAVARGDLGNPAREADYALKEWDERWGKEGA